MDNEEVIKKADAAVVSSIKQLMGLIYDQLSEAGISFSLGILYQDGIYECGYGTIDDHTIIAGAHTQRIKDMKMHANQCDGECGTCSRDDKGEHGPMVH